MTGEHGVWQWSGSLQNPDKTSELLSFSAWCGSLFLLLGTGDDSRVEGSWRRFLRRRRPSTWISCKLGPRWGVQWLNLGCFSACSLIQIVSPTFTGMGSFLSSIPQMRGFAKRGSPIMDLICHASLLTEDSYSVFPFVAILDLKFGARGANLRTYSWFPVCQIHDRHRCTTLLECG